MMSQPKSRKGSAPKPTNLILKHKLGDEEWVTSGSYIPEIVKEAGLLAPQTPPEHVHEYVIPVEWHTRFALSAPEQYVTKLRCACGDEGER